MHTHAALDDLTVLDLSHALAGPFASTMLANFGADVIKIEPPGTGDIARSWGPPFHGRDSSYFVSLHPNKKSIELDLKHPEGKEIFFRLLDGIDVVLENFRTGTVEKLGIDYRPASARQPRVVYCSISGFGQDGPYRDRAALDLIVQAESGMISVTGPSGGPNVRCGVSIADQTAGMVAAFGILAAIHSRERTGRGQFIDVSMLEGQLSLLHAAFASYLSDRVVPEAWGTAYAALLPYQTFRTKTRDLALGVGSDKSWRALCPLMGIDALADDPRYATNAARIANRESLIQTLQKTFLTKTYEEWEPLLLAKGVPVGSVNRIDEVAEHPQVRARGALVQVDHAAGPVVVVGPPMRMSETPAEMRSAAPVLGQHTDLILRDRLGLDDDEIARLRVEGVIGG
jgi:crotonobetainyl-CoA:carnitine CoA-transferase CaiB-like acyl-CoA transferase